MKRNRSYYIILVLILFVVTYSAYAAYQKQKNGPVFLDNHVFQRYNDQWGLWVDLNAEKKSLLEKASEFGVLAREVMEINHLTDADLKRLKRSIFFPYSAEYMRNLQEKELFRETIESPIDQFIWPVLPNNKSRISSRIGRRWNTWHTGLDIAIPKNSIVLAAADGVVEEAGRGGDYGLAVKIYHHDMNHFHTVYGHNQELLVKPGDVVKKGQIIAFSGNTGKSTGPHVHFEVRFHNVYLNPENFLTPFEEGVATNLVGFAD
ncbi:peptidase, M23 family [Leptospira yanagawae serovar Saopaulo str. Sao Paulo = ATCC 700523]|uniref:Peptidase, M23 family n=1 Tax=Leptospira yanagawae serovar Saopaulo str. Sao Paulo = ATCC 700523 TaxID=1249483 RepID=A0A5E8HD96_9LEPT|nr:M23 family metallopeptidase [Leptospira yanagawae]EOQ88470.1 peptidase, M23 family [Leptospira yanagawae serovar Saopaulo str. Sao Paulo = ATCC 700523]